MDVIHTDGAGMVAYYGTLTPMGHMDFYPNEGKYQPGCWTYATHGTSIIAIFTPILLQMVSN